MERASAPLLVATNPGDLLVATTKDKGVFIDLRNDIHMIFGKQKQINGDGKPMQKNKTKGMRTTTELDSPGHRFFSDSRRSTSLSLLVERAPLVAEQWGSGGSSWCHMNFPKYQQF